MVDMSKEDLVYAADHGIIDLKSLQSQIDIVKRKEYLERHPYAVREYKGSWIT